MRTNDGLKSNEGFYRTMKMNKRCPKCDHKLFHCVDTECNMGFSDNDTNLYEWEYCAICNYYKRL